MNVIQRLRHTAWFRNNAGLLLVSAALFAANQFIEWTAVLLSGQGYDKLCNWDCSWYAGIVQGGYDLSPHGHARGDAANWAFFPLLPLVARALAFFSGFAPQLSLVLASKLFFLLAIFAFVKFARAYDERLDPIALASIAALNPYAIYDNVGYTESLFLLLSCAFFYHLRRGNLVIAGIMGGALSAARVVGVLAVFSYLVRTAGAWRREPAARERILLGLLLLPLGLGLFMAFLYWLSGDALAFSHIQRAWDRVPGNPFAYIAAGLRADAINRYWAVMTALALLVPLYFAWSKRFELALYSLGCTLIPLSTGLWAMPRYIWWQAPVLLALAMLLRNRLAWVVYLGGATAGLTHMYLAWLGGKGFVI